MAAPDSAVAAITSPLSKDIASPAETSFSGGRQTEVGELPGHSLILDSRTLGKEIWQIFKKTPDLPGIIFAQETAYAGMISNTQFLKIMSRPFGREIFEGRPVALMLKELPAEALILNWTLGIQNAIEACLDRPKDFIYEPFLVVNPEKNLIRVCTVQVLMHVSAQAAILRNRQMEQILGTVTDGLLLIDRDFRVGSEHSKALEPMLGRSDLSGKLFTDLLAPLLEPRLLPQAVEYLQVLFDKKLIDRLIKSINPIREITVTLSNAASVKTTVKHLAVDFERIHNRGEISQILVRIQDITRRVNFARELEQREEAAENRMKLMVQIVAVEPTALKAFLSSCENEIAGTLQLIATLPPGENNPPVLESIFRAVHRLKGDAALLQLGIYKELLHCFEDRLENLRQPGSAPKALASLEPGLNEILQSVREARSILDQFGKWNIEVSPVSASPELPIQKSSTLISKLQELIDETASRLGKKARLHTLLDETLLPVPYRELLKDVLVQLVRNSLAHGIEIPSHRELLGKPSVGILQIALEKNSDSHEIIFQDDGAGLDWEKIRQRALELDLPIPDEESLKNALFAPGFSTSDKITEDSGRGVGLDLVRTRVTALGGRLSVHSERDTYCAFQIFLPRLPGETS